MPYVQLNTNLTLNNEQLHTIKSKAAELIVTLPNKKPERTMIEVNDRKQMYFACNEEPCAYIHVALYKACAYEAKSAYCKVLSEMLAEAAGIDPARIYLTMAEYENWGSNANYVG